MSQRLNYRSQQLSHGRGSHAPLNLGNSILCERPLGGGDATDPLPVPGSGGSDVCCVDAPSPSPCTCCLRWMRDTPSAVCWALTSRRSLVTARTNTSSQSRHWTTSSMARPDSFPEPDLVAGGMVTQSGLADTRMSRARAQERYGRTEALRLYLLITSRGLGPRRHDRAVTGA
jgi:hypothetical protein